MRLYDKYFVPFPTIKTERLILRKMQKTDVDDLYDYCRRAESCKYSNWSPHSSRYDTKDYVRWMLGRYLKHQALTFVIEYEGRVIGTASYMDFDDDYKTVEIGYGINSDYWGRGLGTETVNALISYAFGTVGVIRVFARVIPENTASSATLTGCGFTLEGVLRKSQYHKGAYKDIAVYSMLSSEYRMINKS